MQAREALARVPFLVSLELRHSAVTELADVVFPVAAAVEKAGTFVDWEGRERPFEAALPDVTTMTDLRVLNSIAAEMGLALGLPGVEAARSELSALTAARPTRAVAPSVPAEPVRELPRGELVLATWSLLLDDGRLQDGEPHLAGTRKRPVLHLSAATAAELGVVAGDLVRVGAGASGAGSITLPLVIADLPDGVVWLPTHSPGSHVREELGAAHGGIVTVAAAPKAVESSAEVGVAATQALTAQEVSS